MYSYFECKTVEFEQIRVACGLSFASVYKNKFDVECELHIGDGVAMNGLLKTNFFIIKLNVKIYSK